MNPTTANTSSLGGRRALLEPASLESNQQGFHAELAEKILPWAEEAGFQAVDAEGCVLGAVETFGEKGVVDMVFLAGNYMNTCALLNTFAVPTPTTEPA